MKQHIRFIINPFSGVSDKKRFESQVARYLDSDRFDASFRYTEAPGHGSELTRQAIVEQIAIVAAVGGDGTVNEIASELVNQNTSLAVLPGGSGNGFAMHLGMGRNIYQAVKKLNQSQFKKIDSCYVNNEFFINVAGIGFDAVVSHRIKGRKKRGIGLYLRQFALGLRQLESIPMTISTDQGQIKGEYINAVAANASMYGYHFTIAPLAQLNDGLFDLMLIEKARLLQYVFEAPRFLTKTMHKSKLVKHIKTHSLHIQTHSPSSYYQIDGEERAGQTEYNFTMKPSSLQVLIPSSKTHI